MKAKNDIMFNKIYLTGFMTSGKSTIGPILSNVLGWEFYDLDKIIEEKIGKTIVEIFNTEGENAFRKIEREFLKRTSKLSNVVIALGGGTICNVENFEFCKNNGKIIYLEVSLKMIYKRIRNKIDRPLFRDLVLLENPEDKFLKRIKNLLNEREKYYKMADIICDSDNNSIGYTVDILAKKINELMYEKN